MDYSNMTHNEFITLLNQNNIDSNTIHFENSVADGYYVLKNYYRWEVFYRERGKDYDCVGFSSESDALEYLLGKLGV
ncbi:MAG: hypothetical protein Q4B04_05550 [bacterium]|nr:hypothetical protein [bacterium]